MRHERRAMRPAQLPRVSQPPIRICTPAYKSTCLPFTPSTRPPLHLDPISRARARLCMTPLTNSTRSRVAHRCTCSCRLEDVRALGTHRRPLYGGDRRSSDRERLPQERTRERRDSRDVEPLVPRWHDALAAPSHSLSLGPSMSPSYIRQGTKLAISQRRR